MLDFYFNIQKPFQTKISAFRLTHNAIILLMMSLKSVAKLFSISFVLLAHISKMFLFFGSQMN